MKKITFMCFLLLTCLVLTAVSCDFKKTDTPKDTTKSENNTSAGTTESEKSVTVCLFSGSDDYRIVIPSGATSVQTGLSAKLASSVKAVTGKNPTRVLDDTAKYPEQKKEILLGLTSRTESQNAVAELGDSEYRISVDGDKLVILASNDALLSQAVDALVEKWTVDGTKISFTGPVQGTSANALTLTDGESFTASVILANTLTSETQESIATQLSTLRTTLGTGRITPAFDTAIAENTDGIEILVGLTNRSVSRTEMSSMRTPGYRISVIGKKIVLVGSDESMLVRAVGALCDTLKQVKQGTIKGNITFGEEYAVTEEEVFGEVKWNKSLPTFTKGNLSGGWSEESYSYGMIYDGTTKADYENYVSSLTSAGFTGGAVNNLGDNLYSQYENSDCKVYLSYSSVAGRIRLYAEKKGNTVSPTTETTTGTQTVQLWQLLVDNKNSKANGGMSYVFKGTDGTFFVIDGGYNTETEADNLYNFLLEHTNDGEKPVISGWFISHLHGDHYGALLQFANKYADKVEVKAFYHHLVATGDGRSYVDNAMACWKNAVKYSRLHTGEIFTVAGIQVEVLYTFEDLYPTTTDDLNETSTVIRVTVGGKRILFLGDMEILSTTVMLGELPTAEIKSDIVQVAHHGYEGASLELYKVIDPSVALWPMNIVGWQEDWKTVPQNVFENWRKKKPNSSYSFGNTWLMSSDSVKKIYLAGFGTTEIPILEEPTGDKIGDWNAYYEANKDN